MKYIMTESARRSKMTHEKSYCIRCLKKPVEKGCRGMCRTCFNEVQQEANENSLPLNEPLKAKVWTQAEVYDIKKRINEPISYHWANEYGATTKQLKNKVYRLKKEMEDEKLGKEKKGRSESHKWTKEEDRVIKNTYNVLGNKQIGYILGIDTPRIGNRVRTLHCVRDKTTLGELRNQRFSYKGWSYDEINTFSKMLRRYPTHKIAERVKKTNIEVLEFIAELGLGKYAIIRDEDADEYALMVLDYTDKEIKPQKPVDKPKEFMEKVEGMKKKPKKKTKLLDPDTFADEINKIKSESDNELMTAMGAEQIYPVIKRELEEKNVLVKHEPTGEYPNPDISVGFHKKVVKHVKSSFDEMITDYIKNWNFDALASRKHFFGIRLKNGLYFKVCIQVSEVEKSAFEVMEDMLEDVFELE